MVYSRLVSPPEARPQLLSAFRQPRVLFALACTLAIVVAGSGGGESGSEKSDGETAKKVPSGAIALVGETQISKTSFDELLGRTEKSFKAQQREFPTAGTPEYQALKNQAVEFLVRREQFAQEAAALGITISEAEIDKKLDELKQQSFGGDDKLYQKELKKQDLTEEQLRTDFLRPQVVSEKIFAQLTKDVTVADDEIAKYYDEHKAEQFTQPESREVAHILVKKKAKADELHAQLEDGADFAKLAKKFSQDPGSKEQGGELTDVRGTFVPEFEKVAFELANGEISPPVKTQFGWHIIKAVGDTKPSSLTPLDDVKEEIRSQVLQEKQQKTVEDWVKELDTKYDGRILYAVGFAPPAKAKTETGAEDGATTATTP